jgi:hypothetical protein
MLVTYVKYSGFTSPEYQKGNKIDPRTIQKFKDLFLPGAKIVDEICPAYFDRNFENPYQLVNRSIEEYCEKTTAIFPAGLQVKLTNATISFSELNKDQIFVMIEKSVKGKTIQGSYLHNTDTIEMLVLVNSDRSKIGIASTRMVGHNLRLINDSDSDFVSDNMDKCKNTKWLANKGCPPRPKPVTNSFKSGKFMYTYPAKLVPKEIKGNCIIKVYNSNKKEVKKLTDVYSPENKLNIDLTDLESGFYLIQVIVEGKFLDPVRVNKL